VDIKGINDNKLTSNPIQAGRLRVFENLVHRRIFEPVINKRMKIITDCGAT
jgi:hypothetical protein